MLTLNFHQPLLNEKLEPVLQVKLDPAMGSVAPNGQIVPGVVTDEKGAPAQEPIMINRVLGVLVNTQFESDKEIGYDERLARGRLSRKLAADGEQEYSKNELQIIRDLLVKGQATPLLVLCVENIIQGTPEWEEV